MRSPRTLPAILLALILALAAVLRLLWLDAGWFGVDQARDISWAEAMVSGEAFPWAGPAMRNRIRLGAGYYWFWAIPALVSRSAIASYAFAGCLGILAVAGTARLAGRLGGAAAALFAAAWLAASPIAVMDARIAWAPAALPAVTAIFYLAVLRVQEAPRASRVAWLFFVAAGATQLHLSAVSLFVVAGWVLLRERRTLGRAGLAAALAGMLVPLVPMALALLAPLPTAAMGAGAMRLFSGRLMDLLLHSGRVLEGFVAPVAARPVLVSWWILAEMGAFALVLVLVVAAARSLLRPETPKPRREGVGALLVGFVAAIVFVLFLPAEAWYYYLDVALVPAAVLLGVALARPPRARVVAAIFVFLIVVRAVGLLWWVADARARGTVAVNLEWMRLGGMVAEGAELRARIPTVATRRRIVEILDRQLGISLDRVFQDVHGTGFTDLIADNGFFVHRMEGVRRDTGLSALVVHRGDVPEAWVAAMPQRQAGPMLVFAYQSLLDLDAARLEGCGPEARLPARIVPQPLAYGLGEMRRQEWPCAEPVLVVPLRAAGTAGPVRVVAQISGAAEIVSLRSQPMGRPIRAPLPGGGAGILLPALAAEIRLQLRVSGPADLDLFELHGAALGGAAAP
ncbi:MAG: hypothetical protein VCC00_01195 [Deltaproteobacteria bacterium]